MNQNLWILLVAIMLFSCKASQELPTVKMLDIEKYAGKWYEIARFPNSFEKNMECVSATYSLRENGKINVFNQGFLTQKNKIKNINGYAKVADENFPGRLKVTFFWPFAGDYYVMDLDKDYQYALVGSPTRNFLWILSKEKTLDEGIYQKLVKKAEENGFDINRLKKVRQDCE